QQDLPGHVFDCHFIANRLNAPADASKSSTGPQKTKVLVGGAKKQLMDDLQSAIRQAGLIADQVVPGIVCPSNAFELAMPQMFNSDAVALVDIGFKNT